ncbi:hypothetical protein Tco_1069951 [Tanacetum coccineum]|uniref:Uncharacterized protein n=1 Tax=Tanacetum coccineum TaxID=301880 RepID=A0ABQ5HL41_9ASTR
MKHSKSIEQKKKHPEPGSGLSFQGAKMVLVVIGKGHVSEANEFFIEVLAHWVEVKWCRSNVNTGRANVNTVRANVNSVRHNVNSVRTNVNTGRSKQPVPTSNSNSFSPVRPQGNWGTAVKTSAGYNWRRTRPNSNYNSGSNFVRTDHPLKNMEDRGIFDSGCSGHMTGNKDHLDDFEECKGGSVTFRVEDLLHLVPNLITKVDSLETELKQTKLTMGNAIVKLVKKVKKMEDILKRRHVVLTDLEDEELEDQGRIIQDINDDPLVSKGDFVTPTKPSGEA